jgi:hypothetical protein
VTVLVLVAMVARVLIAVMRVWLGVWVDVAQLAVAVQMALDGLIGGGGHGQVSVECACIAGFDR